MSALNFLSAVALAEQIRQKKLSPVELVEAHLARIEQLNPKLRTRRWSPACVRRERSSWA